MRARARTIPARPIPDNELAGAWASYVRTRDIAGRNRLMEHYLPLVRTLAERLGERLPRSVDVDDLVSFGTFGLMRAIERFEPARGLKFATFATQRIRGAIFDELRKIDWVPRHARTAGALFERSADRLRNELGREPTRAEAIDALGLTGVDLQRVERDGQVGAILSNVPMRMETEPATAEAEFDAGHDSLRDVLLSHFSLRDSLLIRLNFVDGLTLLQAAEMLGICQSRASQIRRSMFKVIRSRYSEPALRELVSNAA